MQIVKKEWLRCFVSAESTLRTWRAFRKMQTSPKFCIGLKTPTMITNLMKKRELETPGGLGHGRNGFARSQRTHLRHHG